MATILRPVKTYGTRSYVTEVAAAPSNYDPILANEVDGDLDTMYAAWNGGVDTVNIKDLAVTTPKLATTGVTAGSYGDQVNTPRISVGVDGRVLGVTTLRHTTATNQSEFSGVAYGTSTLATFSIFSESSYGPRMGNGMAVAFTVAGPFRVGAGNLILWLAIGATQLAYITTIGTPVQGDFYLTGVVGMSRNGGRITVATQFLQWAAFSTPTSVASGTPQQFTVNAHGITAVDGAVNFWGRFDTSNSNNFFTVESCLVQVLPGPP